MPGDAKGNLTLVARVEDNEPYGNLVTEKIVPWGTVAKSDTNFWRRTLWSTGNLAPVWLMVLAISIIVGVWSSLIYLVWQVVKIRKLGRVMV